MRSSRNRGLLAAACLMLAQSSIAQQGLETGFRNPPFSARPHTWWHWMNGNVSKAGLTADLEAMKKAGLGGAQMFAVDVGLPAGPVPYMSPQWREMIKHAVKEADRLGLELCIHNCAGWSSSGGPWVKPEHAMQALTWSETTVRGPQKFIGTLPQPQPMLVLEERVPYYRDIAVLAFKTPEGEAGKWRIADIRGKAGFDSNVGPLPAQFPQPPGPGIPRAGVLNLTDRLQADGHLNWEAPEGEWTIVRIGHAPTGKNNHPAPPEGRGLECDKLSREALDEHWNGMMAKIIADLGPLAGKTLNNALIDSYEVGNQNWTPKFREEFQKRRGYDLLPFLPVITGRVVDSIEASERFLWDFRRTIADLFADNYFGYFGERCRKQGMKFSTEPYGGPFDDLQVGGLADIPMGEFWVPGGAAMETTKIASSAAHTNARRVVGAESFTADDRSGRWLVEPYGIKALGDLIFTQGINRYIFHRYAHQPWNNLKPGMTMGPWGTHLERTVTWWKQAPAWLQYVARCQYLLQSGHFVADAFYLHGEASAPWDVPFRPGLNPELPTGYDYDIGDVHVVLNRMTVKDGRLVLPDGMEYRVLVLPDSHYMTPALAHKIRDLVREGATIVGPKPERSPSLVGYPACDEEVQQMASEVWGDSDGKSTTSHTFGKGQVFWGAPLKTVFGQMSVLPDFAPATDSKEARLVYLHRKADDAEVYFVSNQRYRPEQVDCTFRVAGRVPELWYPDTGRMTSAPIYQERNGLTTVSLNLDPAGSVFVVFRKPVNGATHFVSLSGSGAHMTQIPSVRLEIQKAFYEATDGRSGADVTDKVKTMVDAGETSIPASNTVFGDPAVNVVKHLRVEYTLNGKPLKQIVAENETLELLTTRNDTAMSPYTLSVGKKGEVLLTPWQAGSFEVQRSDGKSERVEVREAPQQVNLTGAWKLRFPSGWGAPEQVTLERLISWPEHPNPGVRYFSGTAEYTQTFDVPAKLLETGRALLLDLGRVKNFAEVKLNGHDLGILWKAPFRVEVTGLVQPGENTLSVKVTNLWPNRLIGDEQLPAEVEWNGAAIKAWPEWVWGKGTRPKTGRYTFTTWKFYDKDSPLLESGLIGPVILRSARQTALSLH